MHQCGFDRCGCCCASRRVPNLDDRAELLESGLHRRTAWVDNSHATSLRMYIAPASAGAISLRSSSSSTVLGIDRVMLASSHHPHGENPLLAPRLVLVADQRFFGIPSRQIPWPTNARTVAKPKNQVWLLQSWHAPTALATPLKTPPRLGERPPDRVPRDPNWRTNALIAIPSTRCNRRTSAQSSTLITLHKVTEGVRSHTTNRGHYSRVVDSSSVRSDARRVSHSMREAKLPVLSMATPRTRQNRASPERLVHHTWCTAGTFPLVWRPGGGLIGR